MLPKDYVRFRLTGETRHRHGRCVGHASARCRQPPLVDRSVEQVRHRRQLLPALYESPEVCGKVSAAGAEATGLRVGTPVVAGAGDQAAGAVGMGIARAGAVSATIGTSGVVFAATDRPALDPQGRLHTFCHAIPGRWHVMGVTQAAGLSLRWFRDRFGCCRCAGRWARSLRHSRRRSCAAPAGSEGAFWVPYLMGERTPHLDPNARAALVGLTASHTRGHIIRAVMEGVAYSLKDTFTIFEEMKIPVTSIRLGGGGARSPLWRQIQADVYAHEVEIVAAEEGAAYGAAILAGVGAGAWSSVDEACDNVVRVASRIPQQPQFKNHAAELSHLPQDLSGAASGIRIGQGLATSPPGFFAFSFRTPRPQRSKALPVPAKSVNRKVREGRRGTPPHRWRSAVPGQQHGTKPAH